MNKVKCWEISEADTNLPALFEWRLTNRNVDRLLVAMRLDRRRGRWAPMRDGLEHRVEKLFGENILESFHASAWPGTELVDHPGQICVIKFDDRVAKIMVDTALLLTEWSHNHAPPLPEDICLFRQGDSAPALVSCTHEKDAWIVSETKPSVPGVRLSKLSYVDLMVPAAPDFCRRAGK